MALPNREIHWHAAGCQAALEGTCQEKKSRAWPKIRTHVPAHGKKIGPVHTQQAGALQTACVDLWHTTMGMHKTEQHSHNTEISKQSTQGHSQCDLVRPEH